MTSGRRIVLGVAGGIAAYKAVSLLRLLAEAGHQVQVVPTAAALRFVGEPTWSSLSGSRVVTEVWSDAADVPHVRIGREAELLVIAPATADLLARAAHGLADDLLTNVLLTARCPVLMAPAMHTEMWEHPATQANVEVLRRRGVLVMEPADGRLAGQDTGRGRLPEPEIIHAAAMALLDAPGGGDMSGAGSRRPLEGRRVVVSAGGTREPMDPVRFLGNASSGRQGIALAVAARDLGADVILVAGHVEVELPRGVDTHRIGTAAELLDTMRAVSGAADAVVMAAAVADFRPESTSESKIKKGDSEIAPLRLVRTVDVLATLCRERPNGRSVIVGFAAETGDADGDVMHHARRKLLSKGCDLLVVNDVSGGRVFGSERNAVTILRRAGDRVETVAGVPDGAKSEIAVAIWNAVLVELQARDAVATPVADLTS